MSKVVRGAKRAVKSVTKTVRKNWKPILAVGAALFTGGLAIGGIGAFKSALASGAGFWSTVGSTMWAGATGIAGTFGIGSGASGAFAAGAGMQGATLMTGAGAQALGLAAQAQTVGPPANLASSAVGTYTGPGSGFMGGGGSLFGGGAAAAGGTVPGPVGPTGGPGAPGPGGGARSGLLGNVLTAAAPALITAGGAYMMAKGEEEDNKINALWGVPVEGGGETYGFPGAQGQMASNQTVTGADGRQYRRAPDGSLHPVQGQFGLQPISLLDLQGGWA